jgi:hypothetical protein
MNMSRRKIYLAVDVVGEAQMWRTPGLCAWED